MTEERLPNDVRPAPEHFLPPGLPPVSLRAGVHFLRRLAAGISLLGGVFLLLTLLLFVAALVVAWVEPTPLHQAIYLVAITALTVGYGDVVPITPLGRIAVVFAGGVGILLTGLTTAIAIRALEFTMREELARKES